MLVAFAQWLDQAGTFVFWSCLALLVVVDVAAVATVATTRSRELVNRWTGPVLVANALLLGTGVGVPVAMHMTSAMVSAVAPSAPAVYTPAVSAERALTP